MELVYLWVEDYKNIHEQGFNFSSKYRCEYDEEKKELEIVKSKKYVNIFPNHINIMAIVGENGSGKSNLLSLIIEQNEYFGIFVFKKDDDFLIFNKNKNNTITNIKSDYECKLNPQFFQNHGTSLLFLKSYMDINTYTMNDQLTIPRRFFKFTEKRDFLSDLHKNTIELFNIVSINSKKSIDEPFETGPYSTMVLNEHFTYLKDKYLHKILKYYPELEKFIGNYFKVDTVKYTLKDLGKIFLGSPSFKDKYKTDVFLTDMFSTFNQENTTVNRLKILCLIFSYIDEEEINKFIFEQQESISYLELYDLIEQQKYNYVLAWDSFIKVMNINDDFKTIIKEYLLFIKEIRREILEFSFTPSLSSGEEKLLYLFINIYDYVLYMKNVGTTKFTIIIDEPDTLLHPNWQKRLISLLVTFIKTFFKDDTFNFILTSHSPFIVSDLPKENVIFLKGGKQDEGVKHKQTFGANIHTLLSDSFFMEDVLMGKFAKQKINEVIENLQHEKDSLSQEEIESIINIIGEPFLQTKLEQMYNEKFGLGDELEELKKEEEKIKLKIEELEKKMAEDA